MNDDKKEKEKEKIISSSNCSQPGYTVEARYKSTLGPKAIGDQIFHSEWKQIEFPQCAPYTGVSVDDELGKHKLLSYSAANTLRWWFVNELKHEAWAFETRLVSHLLETTHRITEVKPLDEIDHIEVMR